MQISFKGGGGGVGSGGDPGGKHVCSKRLAVAMAAPACSPLKAHALFLFQLPGDQPDGRRPQQHREIPEAVRRARAVPNLPASARTEGSSLPRSRSLRFHALRFQSSERLHSFFDCFRAGCLALLVAMEDKSSLPSVRVSYAELHY